MNAAWNETLWIGSALVLAAAVARSAEPGGEQARPAFSLRSSAFGNGQTIPPRFTGFGKGLSPPLEWTAAPAGTRSFALLLVDPDAPRVKPFVHWVIYDILGSAKDLPEGISAGEQPPQPAGARQGRNTLSQAEYFGPKPPANDPAHHYIFQLFALDAMLTPKQPADRQAVLDGMRGHVLGETQLVGRVQHP